ncbi:uncharacterized protein MYCFIDRAFT_211263 [Pseudocercospora fijiensis CIRAD86]|uniref:Uncharacterized protein n=1 Tax=Pseudocercospora fijiensis (strain CIRAD86) TaxID=383855 RepID=M3B1D7_PSEFD|nr:uncharacterized protein MYCFIDRAFT_211263 [Pseudocercospora fijiensis CIRAD86]EME83173.1 hypothetical protein MYCFIDRAFT_211263 [Pseudocercospora fijiensis CIRAD86]
MQQMPQIDWKHYQLYFGPKQKTLSEAISVGIHRAYENSGKDQTSKNTLLDLLRFVIEKYEEDPKKIFGVVAALQAVHTKRASSPGALARSGSRPLQCYLVDPSGHRRAYNSSFTLA